MKKMCFQIFFIAAVLMCMNVFAQDTFSIVAIDSATGEVGSAGASFVPNVQKSLLDDVFAIHPGLGALHTQAAYNEQNQKLANELMVAGFSPQEILDFVVPGDAQHDPTIRQYLIIDVVDGGRCAAFTGDSCFDYANHIVGKNYVIAGNILTGPEVLENMQTNFLNTSGSLADKLMSALQGGREAGGDKRGLDFGLSSLVAGLKVAKPDNSIDSLYLDLFVAYSGDPGLLQDPVDSLQILYNTWRGEPMFVSNKELTTPFDYRLYNNFPNPFNPQTQISYDVPKSSFVKVDIYNALGQHIKTLVNSGQNPGHYEITWNGTDDSGKFMGTGLYFCRMEGEGFQKSIKLALLK